MWHTAEDNAGTPLNFLKDGAEVGQPWLILVKKNNIAQNSGVFFLKCQGQLLGQPELILVIKNRNIFCE
jgi:hypothetical protein